MKTLSLKMTVSIGANPKEVFSALTDSKAISQWSGQKGRVASKVGGKFEMFDGWVKGKVIEYTPGKSVAFTWIPEDWPEGADESVVRYTLLPSKGGTKMVLKHSGFPNESQRKSHRGGWKEFVFDPIKEYFSARR